MDIIKFNPTEHGRMNNAEIVNGIKTKLWVERYVEPGEVRLTAGISSGLREKLPIGSFLTHVDSSEIMIVENHEINTEKGKEDQITITGRSFEGPVLESRVVGGDRPWDAFSANVEPYYATNSAPVTQAYMIIIDHIQGTLTRAADLIPYITVTISANQSAPAEDPFIQFGNLHQRVLELLKIQNAGIRVVRPGMIGLGVSNPNINLHIHDGVDRSATVVFSYDHGEIDKADYFWSMKNMMTGVLVTGRWIGQLVGANVGSGHNRRIMHVDASDIDGQFSAAPTGTDRAAVRAAMISRGRRYLAENKALALTKVEVSRLGLRAKYRYDYLMGDLVTVNGEYNTSAKMRVVEHVEAEDEYGLVAYPTLGLYEA